MNTARGSHNTGGPQGNKMVRKKSTKTELPFDTDTFLAHCARIARADKGWMSAKDASARSLTASADAALQDADMGVAIGDEDREEARAATTFFRERYAKAMAAGRLTDFDHNLCINLDAGVVQKGTHRIVGAVMGMWVKEQAQRGDQVATLPSHYIGMVGEKFERVVTVLRITQMPGNWGTTHIIGMQTEDGAQLTWFSGRAELKIGSTYRIKGTIKDLREYRGQPQTVVTRCKATEETVAA